MVVFDKGVQAVKKGMEDKMSNFDKKDKEMSHLLKNLMRLLKQPKLKAWLLRMAVH